MNFPASPTHAHVHPREAIEARLRAKARRWPIDPGPKRYGTPDPPTIVRALVWCMRDRGDASPYDLTGIPADVLELAARSRKPKRSAFATFSEALDAAIAAGWIESYVTRDGEVRYLPNYRSDAA